LAVLGNTTFSENQLARYLGLNQHDEVHEVTNPNLLLVPNEEELQISHQPTSEFPR